MWEINEFTMVLRNVLQKALRNVSIKLRIGNVADNVSGKPKQYKKNNQKGEVYYETETGSRYGNGRYDGSSITDRMRRQEK